MAAQLVETGRGGYPEVRVRQVRSQIGEQERTRRNLRALGLRRVGHERSHADTPNIWGMVRKVRHLVVVESYGPARPLGREFRDMTMSATPYPVLDRPALHVEFPGGEYAIGESYDGYYSISWSSSLEAIVAFPRLRTKIPREEEIDLELVGSGQSDTITGKMMDVGMPAGEVEAFTLHYSLGSLAWQAPRSSNPFAEVSILSPEIGPTTAAQLMSLTASPEVRRARADLVERLLSFVWED